MRWRRQPLTKTVLVARPTTGPRTRAQYRSPNAASVSAVHVPSNASTPSAQAILRKSRSRVSRARGTIWSAPVRKVRLDTMMIQRTGGSPKNVATGPARTAESPIKPPPISRARPARRAIWSSVRSRRVMMAAPRPNSLTSSMKPR